MPEAKTGKSSGQRWGVVTVLGVIATLVTIFYFGEDIFKRASEESPGRFRSPALGMQVLQDGDPQNMYPDGQQQVKVSMDSKPFELSFSDRQERDAVQICAWTDSSVFALKDGARVADVPCLRPGTGLAASPRQEELFLRKDAHNYNLGSRANEGKVPFSSIVKNGTTTELSKWGKDDVFLTVFVDGNKNTRVDNGEYDYVVLEF